MQTDAGLLTFNDVSAGDLARMTLDTGGDVGIGTGTTSPASRLEIKDNASNNYSTQMRLSQGYSTVYSTIGSNFGGAMSINAGQGSTTANLNFNLNGTPQMKIDVSGRVTTPNQPSFRAYLSAQVADNTIVTWTGVFHNIGSHFNLSNGRFTAPVTGTYQINLHYLGNNVSTQINVYVLLNGVINSGIRTRGVAATGHETTSASHAIYMNAGDYVYVYNDGLPTLYGDTSKVWSSFSGYLVG
jgi:hypothetical protein